MIVHGIPGPRRLDRGDIISLDVGVTLDGWVADAARTFPVGEIDPEAQNLLERDPASRCWRASPSATRASASAMSPTPIQRVAEAAGSVGCALARRPWGGQGHARGAPGPELRAARQGSAARGWHGPGHRADDDRRAARGAHAGATAGRSTRRTAPWQPTSSSRSRSPPRVPASSLPGISRPRRRARRRPDRLPSSPERPSAGGRGPGRRTDLATIGSSVPGCGGLRPGVALDLVAAAVPAARAGSPGLAERDQ